MRDPRNLPANISVIWLSEHFQTNAKYKCHYPHLFHVHSLIPPGTVRGVRTSSIAGVTKGKIFPVQIRHLLIIKRFVTYLFCCI